MIGAYSVSKTTLLGLAKAVSFETAPNNIRVNCIAPGIIRTKFASAVCADVETDRCSSLFLL